MNGYFAPRPAQRRQDPGTGMENDDRRYRRTTSTWEWESNNDDGNDNRPVRSRQDHPPPAVEVNADFGSIVPATKKRRTSDSDHCYSYSLQSQSHAHQYHPYPYHQMQNQNSSYLQGSWNEARSAPAFVSMMPDVYNEAASATSSATYFKEPGNRKKPSESWNHNPLEQNEQEQGSDLFGGTSIQNPYPYLPHPYHPFQVQVFPPPSHHEQLTLESHRAWDTVDRSSIPEGQRHVQRSPLRYSYPTQKQEHRGDNQLPLPLAVPNPPHPPSSPLRHQFGGECYMSPGLSPIPIRLMQLKDPPPAAAPAVDTSEMKVKEANNDNDDDVVEDSAELSPSLYFPNLQVKGAAADAHIRTTNKATTSSSRNQNIWDRKFDELLEYKQQHGHTDVPQTYAPNPSLGLWVNKQRMEHKNREDGNISTLTDERLERLQSIGFQWAKRRGQVRWDEKYNELLQYAAKFGNCHVPTKFKENTALGRWVSTQRAEYKKFCNGQKSSLNDEKIRRLNSIGFAWFMAL